MKVYTIGYEGRTMEEVIAILQEKGVKTVVDVRRYASRGKFSAKAVADATKQAALGYFYWPKAAPSRAMLRAYKNCLIDDVEYGERYLRMLRGHDSDGGLERYLIAESSKQGPLCLLCYEAVASRCHRSLLAEYMGWEAEHL